MKNSGNPGGDGGSSSSNPEDSPRRRAAAASPNRGRGGSSNVARPLAIVPWRNPLVMGRPGVSAFRPYNVRPPQGRSQQPNPRPTDQPRPAAPGAGPSGIGGSMFAGGPAFYDGLAVPIGGGGVAAAPGVLRIGDNPAARKRNREGGAARNPPPPQGDQGGAAGDPFACSICGRVFASAKAMFGHMRSHPDRGWKGAHPPPTFRAAEEFANIPGVNRAAVAEEGHQGEAAPAPAEEEEVAAESGGTNMAGVPDLNNPPPGDK